MAVAGSGGDLTFDGGGDADGVHALAFLDSSTARAEGHREGRQFGQLAIPFEQLGFPISLSVRCPIRES
jgi:hypothetical protein